MAAGSGCAAQATPAKRPACNNQQANGLGSAVRSGPHRQSQHLRAPCSQCCCSWRVFVRCESVSCADSWQQCLQGGWGTTQRGNEEKGWIHKGPSISPIPAQLRADKCWLGCWGPHPQLWSLCRVLCKLHSVPAVVAGAIEHNSVPCPVPGGEPCCVTAGCTLALSLLIPHPGKHRPNP